MRRKTRESASSASGSAKSFRHQPFRSLRAHTLPRVLPPSPAPVPVPAAPPPAVDEAEFFRREMSGVRAFDHAPLRIPDAPPRAPRPAIVTPEAEALAVLSDLVSGSGRFDIADTDEYVEGAVVGIDPRLVRRLRAGEFAYQDHLDLHGLSADQARLAVDELLVGAERRGMRCVLIIHGRGLNSKDHVPVLKRRVATWLARGAAARLVLAFTSARPCDGGAGALYVLLRRRRDTRRPIRVTEGARR